MIILSFLFLVAPGMFLIIASTAYQDWWENELDKLNNKWITEHGNTASQIVRGGISSYWIDINNHWYKPNKEN